jgi:hypothetical protein
VKALDWSKNNFGVIFTAGLEDKILKKVDIN